MDNVIQSSNVISVYDLKGSTLHRTSKDNKCFKDNDFIQHNVKINVSERDR